MPFWQTCVPGFKPIHPPAALKSSTRPRTGSGPSGYADRGLLTFSSRPFLHDYPFVPGSSSRLNCLSTWHSPPPRRKASDLQNSTRPTTDNERPPKAPPMLDGVAVRKRLAAQEDDQCICRHSGTDRTFRSQSLTIRHLPTVATRGTDFARRKAGVALADTKNDGPTDADILVSRWIEYECLLPS